MGTSLAWVAVEALPVDEVLSRLSLARSGRTCSYPFEGVAAHALPGNWWLVAAGGCDHRIAAPADMATLSKGCRAIACAVEEHVNFASAELWEDGRRVWHVRHEGIEDPEDIAFEGQVPARFQALLATVEPEDGVNPDGHFHMDIPLILAKEVAGFRHDEVAPEFDAVPFEELSDLRVRSSRWKFWK